MELTGVCLITDDVAALVQYFTMVFDRKAAGDNTHAEFSFNGVNLAIFSRQGMEAMAPGSTRGAGTGGVTINFCVADVDAEYERLKTLGVTIIKLPATYPWGARSFWFKDPDGNIVDFYSVVTA